MTARSDNFDRADSGLNGSTPSDGGAAWAGSTNFDIVSNLLRPTAILGTRDTAWVETSSSNGSVQITFTTAVTNIAICLRLADADHHIVLYSTVGTGTAMYKKTAAGTYTQLGSTYTGTVNNGDVLKLTANSSNALEGFVNGVSRVGPVTDATGSANTKAGIEVLSNSNGNRYNDWSWADAAGAAFIAQRQPPIQQAVKRAAFY